MNIRENYQDLLLVDEEGRIEYYDMTNFDFFDLRPEEMIGTKAPQWYYNLDNDSSTLMRAVNLGEEKLKYVQELITTKGKTVRQESDTYCIKRGDKVIGAIEFDFIDRERDLLSLRSKMNDEKDCEEAVLRIDSIAGSSPEIQSIKEKLGKIFELRSPVLITGETGTGKEMLARIIHNSGKRSRHPFIYVNCGAIPENLMEGILFGIKKGSFTDAEEKDGLFKMADKGTLFLDEISSMPVLTQSKLLKAIEEKRIRPIGASEEISVDARIIVACNEEPDDLLNGKQLRKDLYFRLSVIQFDLPPLRERIGDVKELSDCCIAYFNKIFNRRIEGVTDETMDFFCQYSWPGNVRELRNVIEGAYHTAKGDRITLADIGEKFSVFTEGSPEDEIITDFTCSGLGLKQYMKEYEKKCIWETLKEEGWDLDKTAACLGITGQTLKSKFRRLCQKSPAGCGLPGDPPD